MEAENYAFSEIDEHGNSVEYYRHPVYTDFVASSTGGIVINTKTHRDVGYCKRGGYYRINVDYKKPSKFQKHRFIYECCTNSILPATMEIDHINHDKTDNNLCNLRIVTHSENGRNRTAHRGAVYTYTNSLPEDAVQIRYYSTYELPHLYYSKANDTFYTFNGIQYRDLHVSPNNQVCVKDTEGKRRCPNVNSLRRIVEGL